MSTEILRRLPLFSGLADRDFAWLLPRVEEVDVPAGQVVITEGSPGDSCYVVLDGEFEISKLASGQEVEINTCGPGDVLGEISLLDDSPRTATVRAAVASRLLVISQAVFRELLAASPTAAVAMLKTVTGRLRHTEAILRQREKMAALGTLAAGLAHELNNPAAAAARASAQLRTAFTTWQHVSAELDALGLAEGQIEAIARAREETVRRVAAPARLDPLTRSDRESDVQGWLEDHGVDDGWELAPTLVERGWDLTGLEAVARDFPSERLATVARWIATAASAYALLDEVGQSAARISEIVKAVKNYSYLDQAPIQEIDLHDGLESTLVILRHKLRQGVSVARDYATDLPHIEAYGSELNQVWTNLIDNAIDAMKENGELGLKTYRDENCAVVEISDTGSGIPAEIQARIFEPFFTTKAPGVGTGLGLHISHNIIAQKHHGEIRLTSRPGATCFQVRLPISRARGA